MMSDQVFGDDFDDSDDFTSQRTTSSISGKKIAILVALLILLALGAAAAVFFSGVLDDVIAPVVTEEPAPAAAPQGTTSETPGGGAGGGEVAFLELPDMVVNLNSQGPRKSFLKLRVAMELCNIEQEDYMKTRVPRIMDGVQVYLRELTPDGLRGSAGLTKMRANLEARINAAVAPQSICGVLFQEVLVQ